LLHWERFADFETEPQVGSTQVRSAGVTTRKGHSGGIAEPLVGKIEPRAIHREMELCIPKLV
jgi:hypothetical protein